MRPVYDVLIIGAGPVGLCFARALSTLGLSVAIVEKQSLGALENPPKDGRDIALTHFSVNILKKLGIWQGIAMDAVSTIREARVYNGTSSQFMHLVSSETDQLAHIVPNYLIRAASFAVLKQDEHITWLEEQLLKDVVLKPDHIQAELTDGRFVNAKLMVAADSRFSEARKKMGIATDLRDFGKVMVVCQMEHEIFHEGVAQECFLYQHTTVAALPLVGKRSSIIITLKPLEAKQVMQLPEASFNLWVAEKLQHRLGFMRLDSERYAHPLVGVYPKQFIAQRFALLGDAAVGMHPVTAHGFNFGLRGQDTLFGLIAEALRTGSSGRDIAGKGILMRYQHAHLRATRLLYLATNSIVGLYTNDSPPFRMLRRALLNLANHMTPLKSLLMSKLIERA